MYNDHRPTMRETLRISLDHPLLVSSIFQDPTGFKHPQHRKIRLPSSTTRNNLVFEASTRSGANYYPSG
jgi:hypothetical protein